MCDKPNCRLFQCHQCLAQIVLGFVVGNIFHIPRQIKEHIFVILCLCVCLCIRMCAQVLWGKVPVYWADSKLFKPGAVGSLHFSNIHSQLHLMGEVPLRWAEHCDCCLWCVIKPFTGFEEHWHKTAEDRRPECWTFKDRPPNVFQRTLLRTVLMSPFGKNRLSAILSQT